MLKGLFFLVLFCSLFAGAMHAIKKADFNSPPRTEKKIAIREGIASLLRGNEIVPVRAWYYGDVIIFFKMPSE